MGHHTGSGLGARQRKLVSIMTDHDGHYPPQWSMSYGLHQVMDRLIDRGIVEKTEDGYALVAWRPQEEPHPVVDAELELALEELRQATQRVTDLLVERRMT